MIKNILVPVFLFITSIVFSLTIDNNMVIDEVGNKVPLKTYKRIVILDPGVIETFYMIGAEDKIAAIGTGSKTKIYPYEKTSKLKNIGHMVNVNFENILECNPDLVILNPMGSKTREKLNSLNIPVIVNSARSFKDILDNTVIYGKLTACEKNANLLTEETEAKLKKLKAEIQLKPLKLKGGILYSTSPMMGFKKNSLPGEILDFLQVENIIDKLPGNKPIISQEYILQENPDFLAGAMMIKNANNIINDNPLLRETKAGKNNNIFLIDSTKTLRGSPRIFQALEDLYNQLDTISENTQN